MSKENWDTICGTWKLVLYQNMDTDDVEYKPSDVEGDVIFEFIDLGQ